MKVHNNVNYLKSLGPTTAETQAAMKAEQKRKDIKLDSEATEKMREFQDKISGAKKKLQDGPGSRPRGADPEKSQDNKNGGKKAKESPEDLPPQAYTRVDIKA
jgi:hypothetical protein